MNPILHKQTKHMKICIECPHHLECTQNQESRYGTLHSLANGPSHGLVPLRIRAQDERSHLECPRIEIQIASVIANISGHLKNIYKPLQTRVLQFYRKNWAPTPFTIFEFQEFQGSLPSCMKFLLPSGIECSLRAPSLTAAMSLTPLRTALLEKSSGLNCSISAKYLKRIYVCTTNTHIYTHCTHDPINFGSHIQF